ncbi:MAG: hypothetical protein KatS3mg117_1799 [Geminicoccaceae bacterium]|jgi:hypothetical protein|nr:MAG: hypothetical protein KatS3mg117_1799 [Geminicoccaceae bacterium]
MEILLFVAGTVALLAGWWWLARKTAAERDGLARVLGLAPLPAGPDESRAERGFEHQQRVAAGTLGGRPVELWIRSWRRARRAGPGPSIRTLLVLPIAEGGGATRLGVEPRSRASVLDAWFGPSEEVATGDPDFDSTFAVVTSDSAKASALLDSELRRGLLAWRRRFVGAAGSGAAEKLADAAAGAVLEVEPGRILWAVPGSPRPELEERLRAALPFLEALARKLERAADRPDRAA